MPVTPAAQQLVDEVADLGSGSKAEVLDEVDGLGFQREVRLNPAAVKALGSDAVKALAEDERIESTHHSAQGLRVVFVGDTRADYADEFGLADVASPDEEPEPKKAAAKKAAQSEG